MFTTITSAATVTADIVFDACVRVRMFHFVLQFVMFLSFSFFLFFFSFLNLAFFKLKFYLDYIKNTYIIRRNAGNTILPGE